MLKRYLHTSPLHNQPARNDMYFRCVLIRVNKVQLLTIAGSQNRQVGQIDEHLLEIFNRNYSQFFPPLAFYREIVVFYDKKKLIYSNLPADVRLAPTAIIQALPSSIDRKLVQLHMA